MRRRWIACGLLTFAALSCAAAPAVAAQRAPSASQLYAGVAGLNERLALMGQGSSSLGLSRDRALSELRFVNRDGYTISVTAFGQTVALDVSRARFRGAGPSRHRRRVRERVSETTYLAHGRVTPRSIEASFGDRGRIAVRFRPSGRKLHATRKAGCKRPSDAVIADLGSFDGELRFRGEGGFTSVDAHRMPGRSVNLGRLLACLFGSSSKSDAALPVIHAPLGIRLPGLVAERSGPSVPTAPTHPGSGPRSTTLVADHKEALARIIFTARVRGDGRPRFLAVDQASEGSLGIVRLAYVRGAASAFSFDDILSSATVSPPPPFHGSAELRRGPRNAKSWSGPLAVSFLGAPHLPLTGTPFGASLSQGF